MSDHLPLSTDMNADRWAKEFVALHGGDEDLMRTWFVNAIMCGWDNHYWTTSEYKTAISKHLTSPSWSIPLITMTEFPFIYVCSRAGKIGNFRWVNSDTRWPDWIHKRWIGSAMRRGYWGRCGLVNPPEFPDSSTQAQ